MNPTEQRTHRTATNDLAQRIDALTEATQDELTRIEHDLRELIGAERTHRLKLADEQRGYVDGQAREARQVCQDRWIANSESHQNILRLLRDFRDRDFLGRIRWIIRGL